MSWTRATSSSVSFAKQLPLGADSSRHRNLFPSVDPLFKLFYLSLKNISNKWTLPVPNWPRALSYFAIDFEDRMPNNH